MHEDHARRDDGFTLMEVVVAIAVFTITMTVALVLIVDTTQLLRSNTQRVAAANLATAQIESARSQRALDVPDGATTRTEVVGGTTYTVTQDADYVVGGAGGSTCLSTGDQLSYKLVTVTVEWPGMGSVEPVRSDTLLALGVGDDDLDAGLGALAVGVTDGSGDPLAGATVTLDTGAVRTTGTDGCVVFTDLVPRDYTTTIDRTGLVGPENEQVVSSTASVTAGQVARTGLMVDVERRVQLTLAAPAGHTLPAGVDLRYRTSQVSGGAALPGCDGTATACLTPSLTARYLFPDVYDFWAGACLDARESAVSVDLSPDGAQRAVEVPLAGIHVRVRDDGGYLSGRRITATHAQDSGCPAGDDYSLPITQQGDAGSRGALPHGTWTIRSDGAVARQVTLSPGVVHPPIDLEEDG